MITNQPDFTACKITPERGGRTAVGTFADLSVIVAGAQARIASTTGRARFGSRAVWSRWGTREVASSCEAPEPPQVFARPIRLNHFAVTGLEHGGSMCLIATSTPPPSGGSLSCSCSVADSSFARHGFALERVCLISAASGLMTEFGSGSSRSTHATAAGTSCGRMPGYVAVRSSALDGQTRSTPSRVRTPNSGAVQYSATALQPARRYACQVRSPSPCPTLFKASGRPARSNSRAGDSVPVSRSPWPGTRRTDSHGATAGRAPPSSRSLCCCAPRSGRVLLPTTGHSSGRSSRACRGRTSRWRSPRFATGLPHGPHHERRLCRNDSAYAKVPIHVDGGAPVHQRGVRRVIRLRDHQRPPDAGAVTSPIASPCSSATIVRRRFSVDA